MGKEGEGGESVGKEGGARDPNKREYQSAIRLFHYMVGNPDSGYHLIIWCLFKEKFCD